MTRFASLVAVVAVVGCSSPSPEAQDDASPLRVIVDAGPVASPAVMASPAAGSERAPAAAGVPVRALATRLQPDVLVNGVVPLPADAVKRLVALSPPGGALAFRSGTLRVGGKKVHAIGVDPSTFRTFAAQGTAEATGVWESVARGEAVASHEAAKTLKLVLGKQVALAPAAAGAAASRRLGALATSGVPGSDLIVDDATADALGLPAATAVLLTAGKGVDPVTLAAKVRGVTGARAEVDLLTPPTANPVAFLTGSKAAKAFGAFSYRYFPDGTIAPDARWVRDNIRTETLPIMGRVTCHRLMLTQLRGALQDVVDAGLASSLTTYDGCYVPRFIERNPENSISLHTWGIAIDMDAATNYRGIAGTMNPEVVNIFKRWGFRWGGDWTYTDPMHFELAALLDVPKG